MPPHPPGPSQVKRSVHVLAVRFRSHEQNVVQGPPDTRPLGKAPGLKPVPLIKNDALRSTQIVRVSERKFECIPLCSLFFPQKIVFDPARASHPTTSRKLLSHTIWRLHCLNMFMIYHRRFRRHFDSKPNSTTFSRNPFDSYFRASRFLSYKTTCQGSLSPLRMPFSREVSR